MVYSHKDAYIELLAQGHAPQDIDDELMLAMLDDEREGAELQAMLQREREAEQMEQAYQGDYLNEGGE